MIKKILNFIFNSNNNTSNFIPKEWYEETPFYRSRSLKVLNLIDGSFICDEIYRLMRYNDDNVEKLILSKKIDDYNIGVGRERDILTNNCRIADLLYSEAISRSNNIPMEEVKYLKSMKERTKQQLDEYIYNNS